MRRLSPVALALAVMACVVPSAVAAKHPPGSVKAQTKTAHGYTCGKIGSSWVSGTKLAGGWFLSDDAKSGVLTKQARHAKGKAKKRLLAQAKAAHARAVAGKKACNAAAKKPAGTNPNQNTGGDTTGPINNTPAPVAGAPVRFGGLQSAAGWAIAGASSGHRQAGATASNLKAVTDAGTVTDAVTSGSVQIQQMFIAPSNKLYAILKTPTDLDTSSTTTGNLCVLAEIDPQTGVPTCVDKELRGIGYGGGNTGLPINPPIQFSPSGAVFYVGSRADGSMVVRKYLNGAISTFVPANNVQIVNLQVASDDTVIYTAMTQSTGQQYTRRFMTDGSTQTVKNTMATFLQTFPDGKLYMGGLGTGINSVVRWSAADNTSVSNAFETKEWFSEGSANGEYYCPANACSSGETAVNCGCAPRYEDSFFGTTTDEEYALVNTESNSQKLLLRLYPNVHLMTSLVAKPLIMAGAGASIIQTGLSAGNGPNITTVIPNPDADPASAGYEKTLIPTSSEIEVYHIAYRATGNKILFDGFRFSDSQYVIGQVNLSGPPNVVATATGTVKWADLQSFG